MTNQCKGICTPYIVKKKFGLGRYDTGQKRCQICRVYIKWDGLYCPCCSIKLRSKPRHNEKRGEKCSFCNLSVSFWCRLTKWMKYRGRTACVKCWLLKTKPKCISCQKVPEDGIYRIPLDGNPMCTYCYRKRARQVYKLNLLTIQSKSST